MDYFWIRQDERYMNVPHIHKFIGRYRRSDFTIVDAHKIDERNVVMVDSEKPLDYMDVIDRQIFLINEDVKCVFEMYDPSISYKTFCLLDNVHMDLKLYYAPIIPLINGTDEWEKSVNNSRRQEDIVLKQAYLGTKSIVRVRELPPDGVVARLDVVESLLRRGLHKMRVIRQKIE